MARHARIVVPGAPHHVTQRGNRRERACAKPELRCGEGRPIFFEDGDQEVYRDLLAEQAERRRAVAWAYCRIGLASRSEWEARLLVHHG
jgi:putative transposase